MPNVENTNFYEILGCDQNASYQELKKCYHKQIKKVHPDKAGTGFEREFLILEKAWETLRDIDSRREYDLNISKQDMSGTPVYCEVDLSEMDRNVDTDTYSYECRCGGLYILHSRQILGCQKLRISCDECTFQILVTRSDVK